MLGVETVTAGAASWSGVLPAVGSNSVVAAYSGDAGFAGSSSAPASIAVSATTHLLVVSQLRFSGPGGASDSYVELQNTSPDPLSLAGWDLVSAAGSTALRSVVVAGGGSYLVAGSAYSLTAVATPDQTAALAAGVEVVAPDATVTDTVGDTTATTGFFAAPALAAVTGTVTTQYAYVRRFLSGAPVDTGADAPDFSLISVSGAALGTGAVPSALGTPSPQATTSPVTANSVLTSTLLDPGAASAACPNRCYTPGTSGAPGTLTVSRTITNTSETASFSTVVVRVTALSETGGAPEPGVTISPNPHADLEITDPATTTSSVLLSTGATVTVDNLSPDAPTVVPPGGGLGTTLTVPLATALGPQQSVNVSFVFAVDGYGAYWFGYNVDATATAVGPGDIISPGPSINVVFSPDTAATVRPSTTAGTITQGSLPPTRDHLRLRVG